MYHQASSTSIPVTKFVLPFEGQLNENNRWVIMADLVPWMEFESEYAQLFEQFLGAPAKSFRMTLGALIIQQKLKITDRETVEQIQENPYLQYFVGLEKFTNKIPFDSSTMVNFRKRINSEMIEKINKKIVEKELKKN
jgi:hypothetical protein